MKQISILDLQTISRKAQASSRRRANFNLHPVLEDPIQRLAIAMEPDTYVRPHRHLHTWELLTPLSGRFLVLHFDDDGVVIDRVVLGEDCAVLETPAGVWHAVLSLDIGGVIFEVKHGPYAPIADQDYLQGSSAEGCDGVADTLVWYGQARIGDRLLNCSA